MSSQVNREANLLSESCIGSLKLWHELIEKHLEGQEKDNEINQLEEITKDYCLIDFKAAKSSQACQEVVDYFNNEENDLTVDVEKLYKDKLANNRSDLDNYQQQKFWKEVFMEANDRDVEEVQETGNEEATEYEEMQGSIFYSNVFTPPVDPISKTLIKNPYKNSSCGHVYEYKFILQYIKSMKNKAKCPFIGCGNRNINIAQLVEDHETKKKIEDYVKNKSQSSQSSQSIDDDDDDEED